MSRRKGAESSSRSSSLREYGSPELIYKLGDEVAPTLGHMLQARGWRKWDWRKHLEHEWNLLWSTKRIVSRDLCALHPFQKVNHFRMSSGITKKDSLIRNLKRMRGNFAKAYRFYPLTYTFPRQFAAFVTDEKSAKHSADIIWIAKPCSGRRGQNITVFRKAIDYIVTQPVIVQRYIANPLLIGGYKFDLRIYVLVTSFRPLRVWLYDEALVRFSTEPYSLEDLGNRFVHLTNASVNKDSTTFECDKEVIGKGAKWTLDRLWRHLADDGFIKQRTVWPQVADIAILTLLSIVMDVQGSANCFELFGFDVLIDAKGKCWILEVNGSPAIAVSGSVDRIVKPQMLSDVIDTVGAGKLIDWKAQELKATKTPSLPSSRKPGAKRSGIYRRSLSRRVSKSLRIERKKASDRTSHSSESTQQSTEETAVGSDATEWRQPRVGGFGQIFPFNAKTQEANATLKFVQPKMFQKKSREFNRVVVSEVLKRKRKRK